MQSGSTPQTKDYFNDLDLPNVEEMQLQLKQLVEQGVLTPEDAQAALAGESDMNGITLDPKLKENQMAALTQLMDIGESGGMTLQDKANLAKISTEEMAQQKGQRDAILQNAQARGVGGSGLELMSQLQNQQSSATRQSQRDLDVAAQAQNRALEALMKGGEMSGQMADQSFNQQAQKAGANDAISKFNAQNQQQINMFNTGARNAAQEANLTNKQNIANQNVGLSNEQQQYNKNLQQQQFDNEMKKRSGQAGIGQANAQAEGQNSQNRANAWNNTIGMGLSAGSLMAKSDERCKEDIEEMDASDFLDNITGYKFKYKDKADGEGEKIGVMAQDLMKSEAGSDLVQDSDEGLMVDYSKAGPHLMSSVANLHKRLKRLEGDGDNG